MEYLALEIFDLATKENPRPTGSKYATLSDDTTITIIDTSEIFASGDVWSHSFKLNVKANAHIFGTSGEIHGARLHDQINKRRARLWVMGLPLYLGYLKLDDEVDVDDDGNVDVSFESGQKTFEEMIEGVNAREVSVGDVPIGVALNRKRVTNFTSPYFYFKLTGLDAYAAKYPELEGIQNCVWQVHFRNISEQITPYIQRWPKFVKSHGRIGTYENGQMIWDDSMDYTNIQTPYDPSHPFCNINICYPFKSLKTEDDSREEIAGRGYTLRSARDKKTTDGGDNQTRYNNAPNFYLLYFIDRLFKDMGINITENQAKDIEDMRRVFMLNYGCFYEEIEDSYDDSELYEHKTPSGKVERYGQYYMPFVDDGEDRYIVKDWGVAGKAMELNDIRGKALVRNLQVIKDNQVIFETPSVEGVAEGGLYVNNSYQPFSFQLNIYNEENNSKAYSSYLAYATGENYPNVEIGDIINAMKSMFGVRLLFNSDYSTVRIVMLKNILTSTDIQEIACDIVGENKKENSIRGFRMTYGKGTEDTSFYYKGFADLFQREAKTWRDTTDKHDYTQWDLNADYNEIKQYVSAFNKICYVTPLTGNAYIIKVDEDEAVLFPSLFEAAPFMDAEDGDCSGDAETIEEIQVGATPVIMSQVGDTYASLFSGEMKAPSPDDSKYAQQIATFGRITPNSMPLNDSQTSAYSFTISGTLDAYPSEGFEIRMKDNYAVSNGGTIFDEADPGLCFGIMRGSGENALVAYSADTDDHESNMTWDVVPGDGAIDHPDTCDDYGSLFDYNGQVAIRTRADAEGALATLFPNSNAPFVKIKNNKEYVIIGYAMKRIADKDGKSVNVLFATQWGIVGPTKTWDSPVETIDKSILDTYANDLSRIPESEFMDYDYVDGRQIIVELNSSDERGKTLVELCRKLAVYNTRTVYISNGVGSRFGRFSLKLRAEKPNPYYITSLPDLVRTRQEAADAMTKLYTTCNTDLLNRHKVAFADIHAAGWDCPTSGYTTAYGVLHTIRYEDLSAHEILWTPIKQDGTIMPYLTWLEYLEGFSGLSADEILNYDNEHLILDIDSTNQRNEILQGLQAIYYAEDGENPKPVDITPLNPRYLEITDENLQRRGLADRLYPEYSYFIRNARICTKTVRMELAQLLSIDKTKKLHVGDIIGFIRKTQVTVSNKKGLGPVTMEILYI